MLLSLPRIGGMWATLSLAAREEDLTALEANSHHGRNAETFATTKPCDGTFPFPGLP
jgi:hypothetical protein